MKIDLSSVLYWNFCIQLKCESAARRQSESAINSAVTVLGEKRKIYINKSETQ